GAPACRRRTVDDRYLGPLDGRRVVGDAQPARRLARRRAQRARERREVVRGVQPLDRVAPVVPPRQRVPLGSQVPQRTTLVTERDAAVHAASGLVLELRALEVLVDLAPVLDPDVDGT